MTCNSIACFKWRVEYPCLSCGGNFINIMFVLHRIMCSLAFTGDKTALFQAERTLKITRVSLAFQGRISVMLPSVVSKTSTTE